MRTLFYGTPALAVPFLDLLARKSAVVGVLTSADKPVGRSLRVQPTPVKARALESGLKVLQPERPSAAAAELSELKPDLAVAVAYGKLLPPELLAVPALGSLNVHFSLLPKYRGAAPVQWSLARGESRTGVTVFWIEGGFDTGPVFLQRALDIGPDDDAEGLFSRLTALGLEALERAIDELAAGRVRKEPQAGESSLAPRIRREDARISFSRPARQIHDLVRGMRLWPTAYLELKSPAPRLVQVHRTRLPEPRERSASGPGPGLIVGIEPHGGILVQCSDCSSVWLLTVQTEGKKPVAAADFLNGLRLGVGDFLSLA
ncbi:MAG: methionyl-tRNA formyltransferase [Elusimicrobia bacterium]|nr:methionyl-tRNA formyltransferase [Elusimicrobiota bacterium]